MALQQLDEDCQILVIISLKAFQGRDFASVVSQQIPVAFWALNK